MAGFYKVEPSQVLVAHDELDLPPGEVRLKEGGGSGGHNGLKDMIAQLGEGFWRLRLGIGHPGVRELVNPWSAGAEPAPPSANPCCRVYRLRPTSCRWRLNRALPRDAETAYARQSAKRSGG